VEVLLDGELSDERLVGLDAEARTVGAAAQLGLAGTAFRFLNLPFFATLAMMVEGSVVMQMAWAVMGVSSAEVLCYDEPAVRTVRERVGDHVVRPPWLKPPATTLPA